MTTHMNIQANLNQQPMAITERHITINSVAQKTLKEELFKEVCNQEGIVIEHYHFEKINKTLEKNLVRFLRESFSQFIYSSLFSNEELVVIKMLHGQFDEPELVDYQILSQEVMHEKLDQVKANNAEIEALHSHEEPWPNVPKKELKIERISTSSGQRSLNSLLRNATRKDYYLLGMGSSENRFDLDIDPEFQRGFVWTLEQKQALIVSLLNEMPIGAFYVNKTNVYKDLPYGSDSRAVIEQRDMIRERSRCDNVLYDGKQRIHAILSYLKGEFFIEINGETYYANELPSMYVFRITHATVTVLETEFDQYEDIVKHYITINTNQTRHTNDDIDRALAYLER